MTPNNGSTNWTSYMIDSLGRERTWLCLRWFSDDSNHTHGTRINDIFKYYYNDCDVVSVAFRHKDDRRRLTVQLGLPRRLCDATTAQTHTD